MTLTELSYYSRKILPFAVLAVLILMIFFYIFKIFSIYMEANKPKTIYTNPVFGKIKKPTVLNATSSADFNFTLDTIEGIPTTATEAAQVFFLSPSTTRFGYREKIYLMAKNLGFNTEAVKHRLIGEKEALFDDGKQKLTVDIANFNFSYEYTIEKNKELFTGVTIPSKTEIENKAIDFLKTIGRYPDELARGKTNIIYHNYNHQENKLFVTQDNREANVVEIDFYRPNIENFPIVSPRYFNSQHFLIIVFKNNSFKVIKAQINFFEKSEDQVGVYPIKTGEVVWEDLKSGKGLVVSGSDQRKVTIKKMFVAYLDSDIYQDYLQPVYVFLGENNFVAYVPAITNEYLLK